MRIEGLHIERWAHGGDAVGHPAAGPLAGMVVFVPGAVPGDVVTVRIRKRKKRWARGDLERIEQSSPHRVEPACAVQDRCGGCPWMGGDAGAQARSRIAILRGEARKALGWTAERADDRVSLHEPPTPGALLGYRTRVRMAWRVDADARVTLGYRARGSSRLVDVPGCPVAAPAIEAALPDLRLALADRARGEGEVWLVAGDEGVAGLVDPARGPRWRFGPDEVTVTAGELRLSVTPDAFLQANSAVTADLCAAVAAAAAQLAPDGGHAVELFAGVGTLTVPLLQAGLTVTAYEVNPDARVPFLANTRRHGAAASFHTCDLFAAGVPLPAPATPDVIVLDPPRQGAFGVMPWITASGAASLLYVSCDVSTAMRDLAQLGSEWDIETIVGFDMFPHTGHQELLAVARRAGRPSQDGAGRLRASTS